MPSLTLVKQICFLQQTAACLLHLLCLGRYTWNCMTLRMPERACFMEETWAFTISFPLHSWVHEQCYCWTWACSMCTQRESVPLPPECSLGTRPVSTPHSIPHSVSEATESMRFGEITGNNCTNAFISYIIAPIWRVHSSGIMKSTFPLM